ncbi:peptidase domain-containing ABC transporter [Pseudoalteromonas sp. OFAV1]|uniref:peptidase domain-containing ABC transporter n=1 Tax=Pseudoalteromonas sp. OFAV1 TaxID=2908892 RepID=UPI001F2127BA|nr:peptidase domain-containing ABC transporter [Pseudoalteromonas sp. OFAV1]MCF2900914.1 peptidase domain-containing ABC transporter [Pseudoalteromonas sp. OFAV1]
MIDFSLIKKVPLIKQSEVAECGLACIAMISSFHGFKTDLAYIRKLAGSTIKGMSLNDVISASLKLNLAGRAYQCDIEDLNQLQLPAILHWDMNHFVVLVEVKNKGIVINDPAKGTRFVDQQELDNNYTGIALELTPTEDFSKDDVRSSLSLSTLWSKITHFKRNVAKIIALSIIVQIATLLMPYYSQTIIDDVMVSHDSDLLLALALGFGLLVVFEILGRTLRGWLTLRLSTTLGLQIGINIMNHLFKLPISFFESRHTGDIYSRFGSSQSIRETLTRSVSEALIDGAMTIALLFVMFYYSWELTLGVLAVGAIYTISRIVFNKSYQRHTEDGLIASGEEQSNFMESLRGMQTIKLYNHASSRISGWLNKFTALINTEVRIGRLKLGFEMLNRLLFGIENVVIMYFAATFVIDGDFTLGAMMAFLAYKRNFTESFVKLVDNAVELKLLKLHVERISDITNTEIEKIHSASIPSVNSDTESVNGDIELIDVSFRYDDKSPFLFRNINLIIKEGESVAITGPSGQGKTTLLKVMMGLLEPSEGRILFDGRDIRELGIQEYRKKISTIMQDDNLFSGTLLDNIALFSESVDFDKVKMSAFRALIHKEIEQMPMGYETLVGDMGSSLSGGQKQRIMIARALYRDTPVLFMDEATSSLDIENEKKVVAYLKSLKKTRISVAHRKETIEMSERKLTLLNGVLEQS